MRNTKWITGFLLIAWLATGPAAFAQIENPPPPEPQPLTNLPVAPPVSLPAEPAPEVSALGSDAYLSSVPLRAVVVVGEIDGVNGSWTQSEIANQELAAVELEKHGVSVSRFYPPNNNWTDVVNAAQGAHFFLYRGHGIAWTSGSQPLVGGFYMHGRFIKPDEVRQDLRTAPNAIFMLFACYASGSAGSEGDLSSVEAQRRVAQYADEFFDIGAGGYFGNWYPDAFQKFVAYLFQGKTLGQAYETFYDYNPTSTERYVHPDYLDRAMWLDKYRDSAGVKYNNAFAGFANLTLMDLFPANALTIDPVSLTYRAQTTDASAKLFSVRIDSTGTTFDWSVQPDSSANWIAVEPLNGTSGQPMQVWLDPSGLPEGTYTTYLRIQTSAPGISPVEKVVPVTMQVKCWTLTKRLFLPTVTR